MPEPDDLVVTMSAPRSTLELCIDAEDLVLDFAWARLLSEAEVDTFARELADSLRVGASLNSPAPSAQTIEQWRHTAEVYADPELARVLRTSTTDDLGAVRAPEL